MFLGYINPTYTSATGSLDSNEKSIKELQSEKQDYTDALGRTREIELARSNLLQKLNNLSENDKEKIAKILPDHIDAVRLIIDIENIAAKYGMSLSKIVLTASGDVSKKQTAVSSEGGADFGTLAVGPDSSAYGSVKLGFSVVGTYDDFISFLKEMENSLRIVDITSLAFNTGRAASSGTTVSGQSPASLALLDASGMYSYSVTIRTYYLK
jgi:Tfp pilus assembly protein PilO